MSKKNKTEKTPTDVLALFIVDESGSMTGLREATVSGFNEMLEEQKKLEDGTCYLSLVTFSGSVKAPLGTRNVLEVDPLGTASNPYRPGGGTALYDAIGTGLSGADEWIKNTEFKGEVVVIIWTDGEENSSHTFTSESVNAMIEDRTALGWNFRFLGSGQAAWKASRVFHSIPQEHRVDMVASANTSFANYSALSSALTSTRSVGAFNYSGVTE